MEFKRLEYCGQHVTTGTVSGVPTTTPTNEGSEHLVIVDGKIKEYYVWTKDSTGASKWVGGAYPDFLDVNNTAINYVPTASGNTNNRNSIVTDPSGDKWIIDANGDATKIYTVPVADVVTTITNTVTGHKIGTYTNEVGATKDINETNTFFQADFDSYEIGTNNWKTYFHQFQYYDEAGGGEVVSLAIPLTRTNGTPITYVPNSTGSNVLPAHYNTISVDPSGDKWFIDYNGLPTKITTTFTDTKYSKLVFVDPINGNDTTGTGSDNKMFKTVTKALSTTDGSGWRVVLAPGTYVESPTVQWPNVDIVTVAGSKRGNTYIQGTVTFTHTSSSSGIQGVKMTNLVHSGAGALYVTDGQVDVLLNKTSAGYIEVSDTQLQGTSTSTISAGTGLIRDSLIANMTISGATSGYTLKSNIIDATGTVTFSGGAVYNIQDNTGNIVTTAGVNMETALIAAGLPSATAKQYMTNFSNKLAMLHPDTNNANVNLVSWNTVTKRLEVSALPAATTVTQANTTGHAIGTVNGVTLYEAICSLGTFSYSNGILSITFTDEAGAITTRSITIPNPLWTTATTDPTATGNTGTLPRFVENTANGSKWYIDGNGVAKVIEGAADGCGTVFFNSVEPATATIFDNENPPILDDSSLKNLDCAVYVSAIDGAVWSSNGTTYKTKLYSYPIHEMDVLTATAGQTLFTLTKTPIGGTGKVVVSRNGVVISNAFTIVGNIATYNPSSNYGCTIDASDRLIFNYEAI